MKKRINIGRWWTGTPLELVVMVIALAMLLATLVVVAHLDARRLEDIRIEAWGRISR